MSDNPSGGSVGRLTADRLAGVVTLLAALAIGVESLTFDTTFPTDPLGPKAFPLVAAILLGSGGAWVALRPGAWGSDRLSWPVWRGAASFVVYALLLEPLGFLLATTLEFVALALLFGGRPVRAAAAGLAFALALYVLFVNGLGLGLPVGSLFVIGG